MAEACFRVVSTDSHACLIRQNNRERNGDEGNPPRQGLRSGRKKGTREGERERGSRLVWFYDSKPEPRFDPSFLLLPPSLSLSHALSRSLESRGHESTHNPSTRNNSTRFLRSDTEPRVYASLNKRYRKRRFADAIIHTRTFSLLFP